MLWAAALLLRILSTKTLHDVFQLREIIEAGSAKRAAALADKRIFHDKHDSISELLKKS